MSFNIKIGQSLKNYKINNQKSHFTRIGRPEGGALMPCDDNRSQQEEETSLFLPSKDSPNEKSWKLCLPQPSQLVFRSIKELSFSCCGETFTWLAMVADPKLQFSANPE